MLRGSTDNLMDDVERAVDDGVNTFKVLTRVGIRGTSSEGLVRPRSTVHRPLSILGTAAFWGLCEAKHLP